MRRRYRGREGEAGERKRLPSMPGTVVVGTSRLTSNMLIKEMMDGGRRKEEGEEEGRRETDKNERVEVPPISFIERSALPLPLSPSSDLDSSPWLLSSSSI